MILRRARARGSFETVDFETVAERPPQPGGCAASSGTISKRSARDLLRKQGYSRGMSFVRCGNHTHWGRYGAAGLLLTTPDRGRVLLQLRSRRVLSPGTWALPGGALERGEDAVAGALREAQEEAGIDPSSVTVTGTRPGLTHPRWSYTYVLGTTTTTDLPDHRSWEVAEHRWYDVDAVPELHPDLARDWADLLGG